jgi:hypothetical protein
VASGAPASAPEPNRSAGQAGRARSVLEEIEAEVCIPLRTPLLRGGPRLRRSRTPVTVHSLRRSGRIAARPRAANATAQAQRILLKKLGMPVDEGEPDNDIERKFILGDMSTMKQKSSEHSAQRRV